MTRSSQGIEPPSDPERFTATEYNDLDQTISTTPNADANKKLLYEYDDLGRKTGMWQKDKTDANKLAAWTFDDAAKGLPYEATRFDGGAATGKAYTKKITAYDYLYNATNTQLLLPEGDSLRAAGVGPTLTSTAAYRIDNSVSQTGSPAVGGLPSEAVEYKYNATGQQITTRGSSYYLQKANFSPQGDLRDLWLGTGEKLIYVTNSYEEGTRRLTGIKVTDDVNSYPLQDLAFTQDDAGNVTSIFDTTTLGGAAKPDHQCFTYDGYSRVTEAWTPKTADCAPAGRTTANIDGSAPYWTSYTYNEAGQRATETTHTSTGDKTTSYVYNDTTKDTKPHTLDKTTGDRTADYTYDTSGNTTSRPGPTAQQSLVWDAEGELSEVTEGTTQTGYLYDANGELLIRRASGDGDTILYFGNTEVRLTVKGTTKTVSGTRYYTANGQTIAVRTAVSGTSGTKLSFLAPDHHGTSNVAIEAATFTPTKRYTTPFGAPRGPQQYGPWPDDKGFLGKPRDTNTGLTHIGARAYDPATGQFISVDPLLELDKHQTLNGYSYAAQNPLTHSDPSGMGLACGGAGGASEGCPTRPGGEKGNGRPNEAVDYSKPQTPHPCNSNCGYSSSDDEGTAQQNNVNDDCKSWGPLSGICHGVGEVFYGAVSNVAYTAEYVGVLWDGDCRSDGGAGSPGCDYGTQYDQYMAEHGYDISSDNYRAPSALAAIFLHNGAGRLRGSGPQKGILEVSSRVKSVKAMKNFNPKEERDFIFDPTTGRFATGADQGVGGHDFLRSAVGANKSTTVGGRLRRGPTGELQTNQWSGHYGMNWNDTARKAFQSFMEKHGIDVQHTPGQYWE